MAKRIITPAIASSEITSESIYLNRRRFMQASAIAALPAFAAGASQASSAVPNTQPLEYQKAVAGNNGFHTNEMLTPAGDVSSYCNFYEFGTDY